MLDDLTEELASGPSPLATMLDTAEEAKDKSVDPPQPAKPQDNKYKGIAILGSHPASVELAPFDDPEWKIYACSPHNYEWRDLPRWDEWFEVHVPIEHQTRSYRYLKFVESLPLVWMRDNKAIPMVPGAKAYPEKELKGELTIGPDGMIKSFKRGEFSPYCFTSSIAYILAKAIVDCERDQIPNIGLWGIMQASENEFCVAPDTRALRADLNWVPVGELKVGDKLIAFDEHYVNDVRRHYRVAEVDATSELTLPCYRMEMEDGTILVSSENHKWLNAECRWIESRHIRADGDYPGASQIAKLFTPWHSGRVYETGYMSAGVDGEGHLTQYHNNENSTQFRLGFSQKDNAMLSEFMRCAAHHGFSFKTCGGLNYYLVGGKRAVIEFLGKARPPRLLDKFDPQNIGEMKTREYVPVKKVEFIGDHPVIGLSTTTGTFIAEGFASHNTYQRPGIQELILEAYDRGIKVFAPDASMLFHPPQEIF